MPPTPTPASLRNLCRDTLPAILGATDGARMMKTTEAIVATDRWNSFDRFHDTTQTLVDCYQRAGAGAAVDRIQTGGRIGSGRWIIQEAQDIRSATVDIVHPFRERVADYRNNPWHAVQWTAATPKRQPCAMAQHPAALQRATTIGAVERKGESA